jgi:hypothetical protein
MTVAGVEEPAMTETAAADPVPDRFMAMMFEINNYISLVLYDRTEQQSFE